MSTAIENFVKAIYKNGKRDNNDTKPGNIAKELGISNAAATDMAKKLAYAQGVATLQQRHPDLNDVMANEEFGKWIQSSPSRLRRYQYADQTGDVDEADDLISTWKQLNKTVATAKAAEKTAQKKAVRAASVSGPRGNADAASSKRVYRRADIRQLMQTNPQRYEDLQPEIMAAYAEGRVRD